MKKIHKKGVMKALKVVSGYQNTRNHNHDFAITPFIFGVYSKPPKIYGLGVQWGWYAIYLGVGFNVPKGYGGFKVIP